MVCFEGNVVLSVSFGDLKLSKKCLNNKSLLIITMAKVSPNCLMSTITSMLDKIIIPVIGIFLCYMRYE